jgi:precorrin-2 methylase
MYGTVVNDMHPVLTERERLQNLASENAKLREMVAQALQIINHVNVVMAGDWSKYSTVMSMARELGVEVDE